MAQDTKFLIPPVTLPELDPRHLGLLDQARAGPVDQLGIGGKGDVLLGDRPTVL